MSGAVIDVIQEYNVFWIQAMMVNDIDTGIDFSSKVVLAVWNCFLIVKSLNWLDFQDGFMWFQVIYCGLFYWLRNFYDSLKPQYHTIYDSRCDFVILMVKPSKFYSNFTHLKWWRTHLSTLNLQMHSRSFHLVQQPAITTHYSQRMAHLRSPVICQSNEMHTNA